MAELNVGKLLRNHPLYGVGYDDAIHGWDVQQPSHPAYCAGHAAAKRFIAFLENRGLVRTGPRNWSITL